MKLNIKERHQNKPGVYIIKNSVDKRIYVGSSVNLKRRYKQHRKALETNSHHSPQLQRFVNKYGIRKLSFNLLKTCKRGNTLKVEQRYLDKLQPFGKRGFNTIRNAYIAKLTLFGFMKRLIFYTTLIVGLLVMGSIYHKEIKRYLIKPTEKEVKKQLR